MKWRCYQLLHAGEGPRGDYVDVEPFDYDRDEAAEEAAELFDNQDIAKQCGGNDMCHGSVHYIEVVCDEGRSTKHEVLCEVKRHYTCVVR
jgi:hypothetical protein